MKPLIILITAFVLALGVLYCTHHPDVAFAGRIAMAVMLVFTGIAHFTMSQGMTMMLPPFIPYKKAMVYLTGIIELAAAIGLLLPTLYHTTGILLIIFLLLILPANIYAALHHIDYQKGTTNGPGPRYLWFRIPLQLLFIGWVYFAAIASHQ